MDTGSLVLFLKERGVKHTILEFDRDVSRVSDLPAAGMDPADDVKSLVCLDQDNRPLVAIIPGPKRLDLKKLSSVLGMQSCRLCPASETEKYTGYPVGAVPPVGHKTQLRTVVDPAVLERETVVGGGGSTFSLVRLQPRDIVRVSGAQVADIVESPTGALKPAGA